MHKYAQNMHIYVKICSDPISTSVHSYAFICKTNMQLYASARYVSMQAICKICKNMHTPPC